jgi:hypothetical protein
MYLDGSQSFNELRHHLRTPLLVDIEGEQSLFRFYDPRVFPLFLATATANQRMELFGGIEGFMIETTQHEVLLLSRSGERVINVSSG